MLRRLAREAVIFSLLGMLIGAVGTFIYMHHYQAISIQAHRDALKGPCEHMTRPVRPGIDPPEGYDYFGSALTDQPMITRAECNVVFGTNLPSLPVNSDTAFYDPNFNERVDAALAEGNRIKNLKIDNESNAFVAAIVGLYGFAGGFAVWILYRLVRFAIKG